jgi:hypothetical protein
MVHQQGFVQLFLNSCTHGVQGIPQNCKQLASVHAHKIYEIYTHLNDEQQKQRNYLGQGVSKVGERAKPFGNPKLNRPKA